MTESDGSPARPRSFAERIGSEEFIESMQASNAAVVGSALREEASRPIVGPDEDGLFPDVFLRPVAGVWPFVIDANVIRNNVLRSCRAGRTVLVSAANMGALRLYCAQHVVDEVIEHAPRWASEGGADLNDFLTVWRTEYMPLLRLVPRADDLLDLLSEPERERVGSLGDPNDLPTVVLTLALGAVLLSEDGEPLKAVYGPTVDLAKHREWLDLLKNSGEARKLESMLVATMGGTAALVGGVYAGTRWLVRATAPWILVPLATALWFAARNTPPTVRSNTRHAMTLAALTYLMIAAEHQGAAAALGTSIPAAPAWADLVTSAGRDATLARACIQHLARHPRSQRSTSEIAEQIPGLGIGQTDRRVREVLRIYGGVVSHSRPGRWQLGQPIVSM